MANIWLVNHYASTPTTGIGGRHHHLARGLAGMGHRVTVIAARHHHMLHEGLETSALPHEEEVNGYRFLRLDVPRYSHAHDKRRMLAWVTFAIRLWTMQVAPEDQPDALLYSSPHLLGFLGAERLARRHGARLVFEVRDIWPLSLVEIGGHSPQHPAIRLFQWIEDRAYARADKVVSNLPGAVEHMVGRGMNSAKFSWISNGIALDEVASPEALTVELATRIPANGLRVAYTGTLGEANSLETLLEAASYVRDLPITFIIVGQGVNRSALEAKRDALNLHNVLFLGHVPKAKVQSVLELIDVAYIGWKSTELYRWGISANKLPEYMYSEKPILHAYSGSYDPVAKYNAGITVKAENPMEIAAALRKFYGASAEARSVMGKNGRIGAENDYDYMKLAVRLETVLTQ
jgi:glycosyltransferase involved in cell wall biosynthesis